MNNKKMKNMNCNNLDEMQDRALFLLEQKSILLGDEQIAELKEMIIGADDIRSVLLIMNLIKIFCPAETR